MECTRINTDKVPWVTLRVVPLLMLFMLCKQLKLQLMHFLIHISLWKVNHYLCLSYFDYWAQKLEKIHSFDWIKLKHLVVIISWSDPSSITTITYHHVYSQIHIWVHTTTMHKCTYVFYTHMEMAAIPPMNYESLSLSRLKSRKLGFPPKHNTSIKTICKR